MVFIFLKALVGKITHLKPYEFSYFKLLQVYEIQKFRNNCPVPDFWGNAFNFSPLRIMFAVGLSYMAYIMLRYVLSMPAFCRVFIINGCWILSKAFSAIIEITIRFLSFNLLMWCITLIDLWILKFPCIPGIKPTDGGFTEWVWKFIFLCNFLEQFE